MELSAEDKLQDLLTALRPWLDQDMAFLIDLAKQQWNARLILAIALSETEKFNEAELLLESIIQEPVSDLKDQEIARLRALLELAHIRMEQLKYDVAEDFLWQARNMYPVELTKELDFTKEDISLFIAQCRFGQGFIQDGIDRAEEILHKLQSMDAGSTRLAKVYQQLGWFYLHKMDAPAALANMRKAMKLAPELDQQMVDDGLAAEAAGNYEQAIEHYFDSLLFNK
jgi:tetratricopeptide (TPR) repeat protein